jgi:heme a synthase
VALVQLDHRVLAVGTLAAYGFVYMKARKAHIWDNLPTETKTALNWTMLAVGGQAAGGVTMLVNAVPTTLAMVHQSGAAAILGTSLWTLYTLRFARPVNVFATAKTVAKPL